MTGVTQATTIPVQLVGVHQGRAVVRPGGHCGISYRGHAEMDGVRVPGTVGNPVTAAGTLVVDPIAGFSTPLSSPVIETGAPLVYSSVDVSIPLVDHLVSA